jgi:non-heme chloroperoxidase
MSQRYLIADVGKRHDPRPSGIARQLGGWHIPMPYISVGSENTRDIDLYYEDDGIGKPVVLVHGHPLDVHSWEKQLPPLLDAGYRVITYDRRGCGLSSRPTVGYDFDTFAADLNMLFEVLDVNDAVLAGFSMGTGEVGRYLARYGPERISKAVFVAPLVPYLLRTDGNPAGVEGTVFTDAMAAAVKDYHAYCTEFCANLYNVDEHAGRGGLDPLAATAFRGESETSVFVSVAAMVTWATDFRADIAKIAGYDLPAMILHGTGDRILPIDSTARPFHRLLPNATYIELDGAPHGLLWTDAEEATDALLTFLKS